MSSASAAAGDALAGDTGAETVRRIALRLVGIIGAFLAVEIPAILLAAWPLPLSGAAGLLLEIVLHALLLAAIVVSVLEVHERPDAGVTSRPAMLAGVLAIGLALSVLQPATFAVGLGLAASAEALWLHAVWLDLMVGGVAFVYLTRRRESNEAEQRHQEAQQRAGRARRALRESLERSAQARIDPQVLMSCLDAARDLFRQDVDRGDRMLERLTDYLRLVLGNGGSPRSTLRREAALAAAFANLDGAVPSVQVDTDGIDDGDHASPHAAGLLGLLLADWRVAARAAGLHAPLTLRPECDSRSSRISIAGPCSAPSAAIERARARVAELYPAGSRLEHDSTRCRVVLEIADGD